MDSWRISVGVLLLSSSLVGCATRSNSGDVQTEVDRLILDSARTIQSSQADLYKSAALNRPINTAPAQIISGAQPLTFEWKGDAYLLIQTLAQERGLAFSTVGLRLPLPLNMDVKNISFDAALDQIRAQVGYRASVTQGLTTLVLQYSRPQP
ncbi:DotD/TraH family lipoprotein [Pseudomonas sp. AB12(2023)]|uniref:DotD/TraH family lipoprotein n=1 Tax=Pseudomonas sp. AB12(2023) TaxID=3048597 RepID=UPI002B2289B4|nr:DotD/TraH family lipoprotein [Pseudomonas sp. AB12(2023)]MEB0222087.1 DotD/TraH family lipoprotein [Pseudomonas sp. AB12(2023)]